MNLADLTNPDTNPLPEEVQDLVAALLEGRVHSLAIVAEITDEVGDSAWIRGFSLDMDENESDDLAFLGSLGLMYRQVQDEVCMPEVRLRLDDEDKEN
jgi:hypothetical protein